MEYSEKIIKKNFHRHEVCPHCLHDNIEVKGISRYAFLFFESIPCYPLSRQLQICCTSCQQEISPHQIPDNLVKEVHRVVFPSILNIYLFLMSIVFVIAFCWSQYVNFTVQQQTKLYIDNPKVHDVYYIDYSRLNTSLSEHNKYKVALIIDITAGVASVVYSRYFYQNQRDLNTMVTNGLVAQARFFRQKIYRYSLEQLPQLNQNGTVVKVLRSENNMLAGVPIYDIFPNLKRKIFLANNRLK